MKWEYKVIEINSMENLSEPKELQNKLNGYGEKGWELVGVVKRPQEGVGWNVQLDEASAIFKKQFNS